MDEALVRDYVSCGCGGQVSAFGQEVDGYAKGDGGWVLSICSLTIEFNLITVGCGGDTEQVADEDGLCLVLACIFWSHVQRDM